MNILDIILIAIGVLFTFRGLTRGFLREIMSLGSVIAGVTVASNFRTAIEPHLGVYISDPESLRAASYLILFLITVATIWILARLISKAMNITPAGTLNHLAGGLFGFLEGLVLCLVTLLMLNTFMPDARQLQESTIAPRLQGGVLYIAGFMPESLRKTLENSGFNPPSS